MEGSPRRCGGQGDILSGLLGLYAYWAHKANCINHNANMIASYGASTILRSLNKKVFAKMHRSMLTTDLIDSLPSVIHELLDS